MKVPADISPTDFASALSNLGYSVTNKSLRHVRLTTFLRGEHHVTVLDGSPLSAETVTAALNEIARHHRLTYDEIVQRSF